MATKKDLGCYGLQFGFSIRDVSLIFTKLSVSLLRNSFLRAKAAIAFSAS